MLRSWGLLLRSVGAAEALFDRFPGASSEQEGLVPVVGGGRIAWAMLNPAGGLSYGPGFLEEMMRDVYAGTGDEMRLAPGRVKEFCPEFGAVAKLGQ